VFVSTVTSDAPGNVMNISLSIAAGASNPTATAVGQQLHVIGVDPLPTPDLRSMPIQAAGRILAWTAAPPVGNTVFEHPVQRGMNGAVDQRAPGIWVWEPYEMWVYPNGGFSMWWDDGLTSPTQANCSIEWTEEQIQT
jgi:hypothetical protein